MKKLLFVSLVLSVFAVHAQVPSYVPSNGLVAYYPFNGNANDASGNGNNGTNYNATLIADRFGATNKAMNFNGVNSYIEVLDTASLRLSEATFSFWIAYTSTAKMEIFQKINFFNAQNFNYSAELNDYANLLSGMRPIGCYGGTCNSSSTLTSRFDANNGAWHHLVFVMGRNKISLFLDGVLKDTLSTSGVMSVCAGGNLYIGRGWNDFPLWLSAKLDDLAIYNRALNQSEITALFSGVTASTCTANIIQNDTTICRGSSVTLNAAAVNAASVTDINGNVYPTINIDTQNWMQKNLNVSKYKNGDIIPQVTNATQWAALTTGAWCWYNNDSATYGATYGKLYNWYAVNDPRGLAPEGWHVPSDGEWNKLVKYLDANSDTNCINCIRTTNAGIALKESGTNHWITPNSYANNSSGFSGLPGGNRDWQGTFLYVDNLKIGSYGFWWSSTALNNLQSFNIELHHNNTSVPRYANLKTYGYSIRALRNTPTYLWSTGATTPSISVSPTVTTKYYCTVSDGVNTCKDSVTVTVSTINTNLITADTIKVCGTSTTISASNGLASYAWSNGANTASTTVTSSGWYKCTVTNGVCSAKDSVYVSLFNPKITQNDTTICRGSSITLNAASLNAASSNAASVTDINGNVYPSVNIGSQTWMQKNLNVSKYKNGDIIPQVTNATQWVALTTGAWCWYNNDSATYAATYGKLYNWYAVNDPRGLAPEGWKVSASPDWELMMNYLGGESIAGGKIKEVGTSHFVSPNLAATNSSGFTALPGGVRMGGIGEGNTGSFYGLPFDGVYWTSTTVNSNTAISRAVTAFVQNCFPMNDLKTRGASVRCLRSNTPTYLWSTGATTPSIVVAPTATTSYIATVSNGINTCKDTVKITVTTINANFITLDTVKACGTSTTINATTGFASYSWSNGATTASTTVTTSGWYKCTATNGACTAKDSVYVSLFNPKITQNDTTVCSGSSLTLSVNASAPSSALPNNLRTGLVGYWPFNGNANDESGNGNNGTVNGATLTTDRFGNVGKAYSFNGINNYIRVPNSNSINVIGNEISIGMWINSINLLNDSTFKGLSKGGYFVGSGYELLFRNSFNGDNGVIDFTGGGLNQATDAGYNVNSRYGQWFHVAVVFSNGVTKIYVDGIQQPTLGNGNTTLISNLSDLLIGTRNTSNNLIGYLKGKMDDIAIYNRAISASEVQQLYSGATSILWSTTATTPSITVTPTATTSYIATVSNGINTCKDTVKISIHPTPLAPAAIQKQFVPTSILAVSNVSGLVSETYRIKKVANAVSYDWSLKRGNLASITHLNPLGVNDTAVTVTFNACFLRDTLCVKSVGVCSSSVAKTAILYANTTPANVSAITTLGGNFAVCIGVLKSFTAVAATPTATQTNIGRYRWTLPANVAIASANADSSTINVQFNTGFTGGNISVRGVNTCTGTLGAITSTTLQYVPPTPTSIVSGTGSNTACINNTISYSVLVAAPSLSQTTATLFRWTKPANTTILSATADSSSITLRFNAGFTGGVLSVKGQSSCGAQSAAKSFSLTSIGCKMSNTSYVVNNNTIRSQVRNSSTQNLEVQLYPNPSSGSFNLKINSDKLSPIVVKVMNINGQMVKSFLAKSNQINQIGSELKSGVYMVIIHQDDEEKVIKAVKM